MNFLLQECLNPRKHNEIEQQILQQLQDSLKIQEFKTLLAENNNLAFIFLKSSAKKIKDTNFSQSVISDHFFVQNIIKNAQKLNFNMFCSFFEVLSFHYLLDYNFYSFVKNTLQTNDLTYLQSILRFLSACFKKYEIQARSNELYSEINENVSLFGETIFMCIQNGICLSETLQIFYYFIFQDIPTFFEERSEQINQALCKTYLSASNNTIDVSSLIDKIFVLFITKYIECCNQGLLLDTILNVLISKDQRLITQEEAFIVLQYIKRRRIDLLQPRIKDIYYILYKQCHISFDYDPLEYTRNEEDHRKETRDAIIILDSFLPFDLSYINFGTKEGDVFFLYVLNHKYSHKICDLLNEHIQARLILDEFALFTVFKFLIDKKISVDLSFCMSLACKFNFAYFKIIDYVNNELRSLELRNGDAADTRSAPPALLLDSLPKLIAYKNTQIDDEFTSKHFYYCCLHQSSTNLSEELFVYAHKILSEPEKMSNFDSFFYLFNAISFYGTKYQNDIFNIANNIFKKDTNDLFSLAIQIFAVLIKNNYFDNVFLIVFSNEKLWCSQNSNQLSLSFLCIELYKKRRIERSVLENLALFLVQQNLFCAFLILSALKRDCELQSIDPTSSGFDDDEYFNFAMLVFEKSLTFVGQNANQNTNIGYVYEGILCVLAKLKIDQQKLSIAVLKCVDELLTKVVNKRNLKRVIKALKSLCCKVNENVKHKIELLLQRNNNRICENNYVLHLLKQEYDL